MIDYRLLDLNKIETLNMGNQKVNVLPLILYKLDGTQFGTHDIITDSPTIYFYSYQTLLS